MAYKRKVSFRDTNKTRWTVTIEIKQTEKQYRSKQSLEMYPEKYHVSVTGEGGGSMGQCNGCIKPRTDGQKKLLEFWKKYHLNSMSAGTNLQNEYLYSEEYVSDFKRFVELFKGYDKQHRLQFSSVEKRIIMDNYNIDENLFANAQKVIDTQMSGNPIVYILGMKSDRVEHDHSDYSIQCLFLCLKGLYVDRGYKYGSEWLHTKIPTNIVGIVDNIISQIENEEAALSKLLNPVFDMGSEDFEADVDMLINVVELRDCCFDEARCFIALGMCLKCTFGDLNDTFTIVDKDRCLYSAYGVEYYIGEEYELYDIAEKIVHEEDSEYKEGWKAAVASDSTTDSLNDWLDSIIQLDGWVSVLNHWDGTRENHIVDDRCVCVCRAC